MRCLNGTGHKHDYSHPLTFYYPATGWYGCNVCGLQGFLTDWLYENQQKRVGCRRSRRRGGTQSQFLPNRIPEEAELTESYRYKGVNGEEIHCANRYDLKETANNGAIRNRTEYLPQHIVQGKWNWGTDRPNGNLTAQMQSPVHLPFISSMVNSAQTHLEMSRRLIQR